MKAFMSSAASQPVSTASRTRIVLVDLARGIALLAMFVFHFAYDLSYFRLIETDIPLDPAWRWFARTIAASFLTLVGISLVLATRGGLNRGAYLKRLAMVAGAAALVTIGTWFAMPQAFIFFGILHQVAFASVLALAFLRLPTLAIALAALVVFALPQFVANPFFDQPWLLWLGLSRDVPNTADFVPVLPWFGWVLTGMVLARLALPHLAGSPIAAWQPRSLPARIVAWGGRHSLLVYLLHQPIFIGLLMLALPFIAPPPSEERAFMNSCQQSCASSALSADACEKLCACTADSLKSENLWSKALANTLAPGESARVTALAQACTIRFTPRP
jgi:uncharacterized membrane protein